MKFSLFHNDKSTYWDEVILLAFIGVCLVGGIALVAIGPSFWIVTEPMSKSFGVLWILTAVMFIPGLIYRFFHNDIEKD